MFKSPSQTAAIIRLVLDFPESEFSLVYHIFLSFLSGPSRNDTSQMWGDWTLCALQGAYGGLWSPGQLQVQHCRGMHRRTVWLPTCTGPLCKCVYERQRGCKWSKVQYTLSFSLSIEKIRLYMTAFGKSLSILMLIMFFFLIIGGTQAVPQR